MKNRASHSRGMTAIEVLAATMLAALMLAAVAGVLGALARQERELRGRNTDPYWHLQLADQLSWDLCNSRQFIAARDGVRLVGYAARDFSTGRPTGRRAIIEYYLVEAKGDRWLVRREEHPNEHTNNSFRVELACRGIDHMKWGEVLIDAVAGAASGPNTSANRDLANIPESVPIQLYRSASASAVFDKNLYVR